MRKRTFEIILMSGMTSSVVCYTASIILGILNVSGWYTTASIGTALLVISYMFMIICANRIKED